MSSAVVEKKYPKPNMAFIQRRSLYKHIYIGLGVAALSGYIYKKTVSDVFDRRVEEFFATYDPYADFERMRNLGLFTSCPPDWVLKEREEKKKAKLAAKKAKSLNG